MAKVKSIIRALEMAGQIDEYSIFHDKTCGCVLQQLVRQAGTRPVRGFGDGFPHSKLLRDRYGLTVLDRNALANFNDGMDTRAGGNDVWIHPTERCAIMIEVLRAAPDALFESIDD